jgi:hypothetical protein
MHMLVCYLNKSLRRVPENTQISISENPSSRSRFLHTDRRTHRHDEANRRFSQIYEGGLNCLGKGSLHFQLRLKCPNK